MDWNNLLMTIELRLINILISLLEKMQEYWLKYETGTF